MSSSIPTGTVRMSFVLVSVIAKRYSFQAMMKVYTPAETSPGMDTGTITRHNAVMVLPPSTLTASSSSLGTVFRYPVSITTQRSEEHTSELQSRCDLVCRLMLEKKQIRTEAHYTA